jgi:hypothetical protein
MLRLLAAEPQLCVPNIEYVPVMLIHKSATDPVGLPLPVRTGEREQTEFAALLITYDRNTL